MPTGRWLFIIDPFKPARTLASTCLNRDIIRGVLIFVVILDHNDIIRNVRAVQNWFLPMTFHVAGFLLLPFLTAPKRFGLDKVLDHAVRYLVPFGFAVLGYAVIYHLTIQPVMSGDVWLANLMRALFFADPWTLKIATGFIVLWFLPALLAVFLLISTYDTVARPWRVMIVVLAVAVHLGVGGLPVSFKTTMPQGVLIALMIFPLGLVARHVIPWLATRPRLPCAATALVVLLVCWNLESGAEIEVATLVLPTLQRPLWVIATDLSDLSFLALVVATTPILARVPGLTLLGRYSLLVYLFHPLFYKPLLTLTLRVCRLDVLGTVGGDFLYWGGAAATVVVVSATSLVAAAAVTACRPLHNLVTPKEWASWLPVQTLSAFSLKRRA